MQIHISDQQQDLSIDPLGIEEIVKTVLKSTNQFCDEVGIYFVTCEEISRLHRLYFSDGSITDCISFAVDEVVGYRALGEVFVCPLVAINYTKDNPEALLTAHEETTLYLIHGLLHLLGFDDIKKKDRDQMHALQENILHELKDRNLCLKPLKKK